MNRWKIAARVLLGLALLVSHTACGVLAYQYAAMERCGPCSAPAYVVFYWPGIPFALGLLALLLLALICYKKGKSPV